MFSWMPGMGTMLVFHNLILEMLTKELIIFWNPLLQMTNIKISINKREQYKENKLYSTLAAENII